MAVSAGCTWQYWQPSCKRHYRPRNSHVDQVTDCNVDPVTATRWPCPTPFREKKIFTWLLPDSFTFKLWSQYQVPAGGGGGTSYLLHIRYVPRERPPFSTLCIFIPEHIIFTKDTIFRSRASPFFAAMQVLHFLPFRRTIVFKIAFRSSRSQYLGQEAPLILQNQFQWECPILVPKTPIFTLESSFRSTAFFTLPRHITTKMWGECPPPPPPPIKLPYQIWTRLPCPLPSGRDPATTPASPGRGLRGARRWAGRRPRRCRGTGRWARPRTDWAPRKTRASPRGRCWRPRNWENFFFIEG